MSSGVQGLHEEANKIHEVFFGRSCPEDIAQEYVKAVGRLLGEEPSALSQARDLEAMELLHPKTLGPRFQILLALAECHPQYQESFVQKGWGRLSLLFGGLYFLVWWAWKRFLGVFQ